jgi:arylsulfatase A-like enzyme
MDARVGHILDKVRQLGIENNTLIIFTTDNGAWQDVYPDAGYTPFRGTKGTDREGGSRVPCIAWWPGMIKPDSKNYDVLGSLDFMATFANLAGVPLPEKDREGQPIIFDSIDMTPVLLGTGTSKRDSWFYFTENELTRERCIAADSRQFSVCGVMMARPPAVLLSIRISDGKDKRSMLRPSPRFSIYGRIPRNVTTSS